MNPPRVSLRSQEARVFADSKVCLYLVSYISTQAWTFLDESLWPLGKIHGTQLSVFRSWKMLGPRRGSRDGFSLKWSAASYPGWRMRYHTATGVRSS